MTAQPRRAHVSPPRPSRGLRPLDLDAPVEAFLDQLAIGIAGPAVLLTLVAAHRVDVLGQLEDELIATTWRGSGRRLRQRELPVARFSTLSSIALALGIEVERAYVTDTFTEGPLGLRILVNGAEMSPQQLLAHLPPTDDASPERHRAEGRVDAIRDTYARLRSDVAYRIECSALFDSTVATTAGFESALAHWAVLGPDTSDEEMGRTAALVQVTFEAARAHAETVGIEHLPHTARDSGRRAASAARLALSTQSDNEREVAWNQVIAILSDLGISHIPPPAPLAIAAGPRPDEEHLPPVALSTPVGQLIGSKLAVGGLGPDGSSTVVYADISRAFSGIRVSMADTRKRTVIAVAASPVVPPDLTVEEVVEAHADLRPTSAASLPALRWPLGTNPRLITYWVVGAIAAVVLAVVLKQPAFMSMSLPFLLGLAKVKLRGRSKSSGKQVSATALDRSGSPLDPAKVWWMLPDSAVVSQPQGLTASDRVTVVKEEYAKLRSDVAYRIENSALFDAAFGATQRFELALLAWDPLAIDPDALATEVEQSFTAARTLAEGLGFAHLPDTAQDTARRAHAATITALTTSSTGEREAAARKAADMLRSLALYYLPTIDPSAAQLLSAPKQIEPAP